MDNVGIVVESLDAAISFFAELGLELEGRATIEGDWAERVTGLRHMRVEIAMMRTPGGHSRLEISRFLTPPAVADYGPTYYGGFLLDPDGNSVEAVHDDRENAVPDGHVDHLWIRVRDPQASRRFYTTIAPHAGLRLTRDEPERVQLSGPDYSVSLVRDERPLTEHVHLAFPARENATVRAFHAAALAAGYADHGAPGERAVYHRGYYGAFVLDPDGHNVEVVNHNRA